MKKSLILTIGVLPTLLAVLVATSDAVPSTGPGEAAVLPGGQLFAGTDDEEFANRPLPDRLARMTTSGPLVTGNVIEDARVYVNGLASTGRGTLFAGDPETNLHHEINFDGSIVSTITGPLDDNSCCNEDMAFDGRHVWRADYGEGPLFQYDPNTGAVINTYNQLNVVGAEFVGSTLWISKWDEQQVGTFDPATNTFTLKFVTATRAGGLAHDPANNILWVGRQGGVVEAWDLNTVVPTLIPGSQFQPFGPINDTVDGLAFVQACPQGDDDGDDDGLEDEDENLLRTLLGVTDSDGDGTVDGNDDANGNGEDDEDEDDGTSDECPRDSDGDGEDDEDDDD